MFRARAFVAASVLALTGTAVFAKDDAPRPPAAPDGTVWGHQCFAESRGQGHLGVACCANLRDNCFQACHAEGCKGPVQKCLEPTTLCLDGCQRAFTLCVGLQPKSEPPPGVSDLEAPQGSLEVAPPSGSKIRRPVGRTPREEKR